MQSFANFLCWRWDFVFPDTWLLFWFWLKTYHRWWVRVVLKKESHVTGRIPHTSVSDHCWDPTETTLHTFGTCLFSLTQCAEPVSSVIFTSKLADNSHNVVSFSSSLLAFLILKSMTSSAWSHTSSFINHLYVSFFKMLPPPENCRCVCVPTLVSLLRFLGSNKSLLHTSASACIKYHSLLLENGPQQVSCINWPLTVEQCSWQQWLIAFEAVMGCTV
jgi:hypothetical protein